MRDVAGRARRPADRFCGQGQPQYCRAARRSPPQGSAETSSRSANIGARCAAGMPPRANPLFRRRQDRRRDDRGACRAACFSSTLESVEEAHMLSGVAAASGQVAPVALRINPDVDAGTHAKITTGTAENKFGIAAGEALAALRAARTFPGSRWSGSPSISAASLPAWPRSKRAFDAPRRIDCRAARRWRRCPHRRSRRRPRRDLRPGPARRPPAPPNMARW